jgi:nucleoside-diphosphate-sugar epimerase
MLRSNAFGETIKYPTSLIVRGADPLGIELAKSLLDQGGFVIMADSGDREGLSSIGELKKYKLFRFIDLSEIIELAEPLRRLDYIFYLSHTFEELSSEISSKSFLEYSRFLDEVLTLATQFDAKLLTTTSIKSHQYNVANKIMDVDLMSQNKVYTTAEVQRYTESLVNEYIQKNSLDARVVRLGELLGEGIEYSPHTTLGRLIQEAINENEITIFGDGLEAEYYVHLQDAVYGLIKAQFGKNTRGEIFSLAYEYEVSALSIAYKMNDFFDSPKEIRFSATNVDDFSFKLYKPAPNLMRIGWKPRIGFERALKQTFNYAKRYFELDKTSIAKIEKPKQNFLSKLFFESEKEEIPQSLNQDDISEYGALGRLIAERKSRDKDRFGSIVLANEHLAKRIKKESNSTGIDRFLNRIRKSFDSFAKQYRWIKNLTIRQFIFYTIGLIIFGYLYLNVFSVVLSFGRNVLLFYNSIESTSIAMNEGNREDVVTLLRVANEQQQLAQSKIDSFYFLSGWETYDRYNLQITNLFSAFSSLNQSVIGVIESSELIHNYLDKFDPQVVYRPNSKSLLSVQNNIEIKEDYETLSLNNFNFNENIRKLQQRIVFLESIPYESFGLKESIVELTFANYKVTLESFLERYGYYQKIANLLEHLIQTDRTKTMFLLLMDNSYFLPSGGQPVGVVVVDIGKGGVDNIRISPMENNDYKLEKVSDYALEQINLVSPTTVSNENLSIQDLLLVHNGDFYFNILARDFSIKEGKRIDGIFLISLDVLAEALEIAGSSEYNNLKFDSSTLITNLDLLSKDNDNPMVHRREIITNIFAVSLRDILNNFGTKFFEIIPSIEKSIEKKSINYRLFFDGITSKSSDDLITKVPDYLSIVVKNDEGATDLRSLPKYSVFLSVLIKDDLTTRKTVNVDISEVNNFEYAVVCLPIGSSNFGFDELSDQYRFIRFGEEQTCIRFSEGVGENFQLSYDSVRTGYSTDSTMNYTLGIRQQPGAVIDLDATFTTENLTFIQNDLTAKDDRIEKVDYKQTLVGDKIFTFDLINQQ